jgi:hypothetical protein
MSAFLVSKAHIDALVTAAVFGVIENPLISGQWWPPVYAGHAAVHSRANWLGEALWAENRKSIRARYPADSCEARTYVYKPADSPPVVLRSALEVLKLVQCYEYQSCEHDNWKDSAAAKFCGELTARLINALPGYDAAPWAVD